MLRYYAQLSERETSAVLGIPAGTVKSRLSTAVRHLASSLEPDATERNA